MRDISLQANKRRTTLLYKYYIIMEATYSETRANFAALWDRVVDTRGVLTVRRRGAEDIAMMPASELSSLMETAHLLRSPKNARRLLEALNESLGDEEGDSQSVGALKKDLGFGA